MMSAMTPARRVRRAKNVENTMQPAKKAKVTNRISDGKHRTVTLVSSNGHTFEVDMSFAGKDRKVTLVSSDGETFEVDMSFAARCPSLRLEIERIASKPGDGNIIIPLPLTEECARRNVDGTFYYPLPRITSKVMNLMLSYHSKFSEAKKIDRFTNAEDFKRLDAEFAEFLELHKVDLPTLAQTTLAADHLYMWNLDLLACRAFKALTKGIPEEQLIPYF